MAPAGSKPREPRGRRTASSVERYVSRGSNRVFVVIAIFLLFTGIRLPKVGGTIAEYGGQPVVFLAIFLIGAAGTVVGAVLATLLLKGALAGLCAGAVYRALSKVNEPVAGIVAAIVAPVVNTGIFLLGCLVFFLPTVTEWGQAMGFESVGKYMILGLVGGNFLFELLFNVILSPVIVRLIRLGRKDNK